MATLGIFLSSEEHSAPFLVDTARKAEAAGFRAAWISDHFHPWTSTQGESPFVWATIGGIAAVTDELRVTTGVTCPTVRMHPAIVAQAAATAATMLPGGRFALGVGSGEALNEHILGAPWPNVERRLAMLEEAVEVMRMLWSGGLHSHHGEHYTVDRARLYSLPDEPPPVIVSGFGEQSVALAARIGDGYASTMPDADLLRRYRDGGGRGMAQAGMKVCFGADEAECVRRAHRIWPNEVLPGELAQILVTPAHYEAASELVTEEMIADAVPCGPDPEKHAAAIQEFFDAGYDEVYVQQIGDDQDAFLGFYAKEILPRFS
ncbi:MAG TPA: TIGR03557 family F420-dependent LLM class oxidoreductase [Baekduia sp.]|nr:TIGR03557 family F420-dependent LLM class oxidoreductase [Baekduia sp.]